MPPPELLSMELFFHGNAQGNLNPNKNIGEILNQI